MSEGTWKIDREKCLKCGGCVSVCPFSALELRENGIEWEREKCKYCGLCSKVCPVGAIKVEVKK